MEVSDLAKLEVRSFPKEDCYLTIKNKDNFSLFKRLKILYSDVGRQYDYMEL